MAHSCASFAARSAPARAVQFLAPALVHAATPTTPERRGASGRASPFTPLVPPAYAVVFAETAAGQVVVLRPPFGADAGHRLQLPVTLVSPGETSFAAARRALFEQTGYESDCWQPLGEIPAHATPPGSRAQIFRVWRARPVAEIWTDGLTVPEVVTLSPFEIANRVGDRSRAWFDLATILSLANPQPWRAAWPR